MTTIGHGWHHSAAGPRHLKHVEPVHIVPGVMSRVLLFVLATVVAVVVVTPAAVTTPVEAASYTTDAVASEQGLLVASIEALDAELAAARTAHEEADGRVLDEDARTALASEIETAEQTTREARALLAWPEAALPAGVAESTAASVDESLASLTAAGEELTAAVEAWEVEQERIAAEEAARAAAAAAAASWAQPRSASAGGAVGAAGPAVAHVEGIWTSGGQGQIDACRGSVNVSAIAGYLGGAFYAAEHWGCGGSAWGRIGSGSLVEFPGYGTFRVAGIVSGLVYGVSDASAIPRGYAGYYQTCIGGSGSNMAVWLLQRA